MTPYKEEHAYQLKVRTHTKRQTTNKTFKKMHAPTTYGKQGRTVLCRLLTRLRREE